MRLDEIDLNVTLKSEKQSKSFLICLSENYLEKITEGLLLRAMPFVKFEKNFNTTGIKNIIDMPFPYSSVREGQEDLIKSVYRCIAKGKRLLAVAPTGIGKTVSVLYPAIKSVGAGYAEKIFYLTAKGVTGKAALDAVNLMSRRVPSLRAVIITAKERICPAHDKNAPFVQKKCSDSCPRLSDADDAPFAKRMREAVSEMLLEKCIYEKKDIKSVAEKYAVCPYELSLSLSEYCTVIVCDCNYAFDAKVRFKRYFKENNLKYIFLIDEAHNLPERTREMYSAEISLSDFKNLRKTLFQNGISLPSVYAPCEAAEKALKALAKKCLENASSSSDGTYGYSISHNVPAELIKTFDDLNCAIAKASDAIDNSEVSSLLDTVASNLYRFAKNASYFDEHFVLFSELKDKNITTKIMCLDPSEILNKYMKGAVSSVLFSATLTPKDYFADITGCNDGETIELDSPYDSSNFCIAAFDTLSTKYSARDDTVSAVADVIITTVKAKKGNYIVYCPSYAYLDRVAKAFLLKAPKDIKAVMQKSGMSVSHGKKFLSFFENNPKGETLVGFCVMGGVFSEGIDLPNEKLIGTIIVGIGLPKLSSELNILKEYYDKTRENGYNFAYLYPAIIKVMQAAGRVIRSENDKGVAILIDDRYHDGEVRRLFPNHWKDMRFIGDTHSLSKHLERFWNKEKNLTTNK